VFKTKRALHHFIFHQINNWFAPIGIATCLAPAIIGFIFEAKCSAHLVSRAALGTHEPFARIVLTIIIFCNNLHGKTKNMQHAP
jgi:hypothetical protein